jgi:GT2 family glycosyltransferase
MALQLNSQITANEICATNSLFKNAYGVVFGRNIETKNDEQARKLVRDGIALPAMLSTWVVSRELFKSLNGFDEKLPAAEDFDFAVRAINNGAQFNIVRQDLSYYLIHSNSKSVLKRAAQRRIGALIKNNNGNQISKEQISASLDEAIGASEFLSLYSDLLLRKFMMTARPNLFQRKYHLLMLSFVLSPRRFISKLTKQGL